MEDILMHPFSLGLGLGLLVTIATWLSSTLQQRRLKKELAELHRHLHRQMNINSRGQEEIQKELESLKQQNENLRVTLGTLQQKPGRAEMRTLHLYDRAIQLMHQRAPGFAPAWEGVVQEAEEELKKTEGGFGKLLKKVFRPAQLTDAAAPVVAADESESKVSSEPPK